ncbi:tyrosine-type recombinase/integrase [Helicobacter sp.]|uniref:tyrosine-type recombinase/integrase n=1 Tax=Helicobacter sp. TaxID=218 RepID=UPI002A90AA0B|nr:tyrosine-type recombinase/integrase [Helicobacter sp.]MDY5556163.1 tyrosine-type recombinase/integrase [Helicobacter sp.]
MKNIYIRNNTIYIDYYKNGKRFRKSTGIKKSPKAINFVEKNFSLFQKNIKEGRGKYRTLNGNPNEMSISKEQEPFTFESVSKNFLKEKGFLKERTKNFYASSLNKILLFLKESNLIFLNEFGRNHNLLFLEFLLKRGYSQKTIKLYFIIFKSLFKYAIDNDLIEKNPLFLPKMKQESPKETINPFTLEEAIKLIQNAQEDLKTYLILAFFTGARTGEILALTWNDIDFELREITINKSLSDSGTIDSPKTLSSNRVIDMLDIVYNHLKTLKFKYLNQRIITLPRFRIRILFYSLQNQLELKRRRLYDTRHSFASIMLSKGEEAMWVGCKMMGHKDLTETYKTYAKYLPKPITHRATFLQGVEL